jgi:dihydropteroate synthase
MQDSKDKITDFSITPSLHCADKIITFENPRIMGILNLTPDSFYDGGNYENQEQYYAQTEKMLDEGADFIDLGAVSTRPGANEVPEKEEYDRLIPALQFLVRMFPGTVFSVDTYRSSIARAAIENGAGMINDISGGSMDILMGETIASLGIPYVLMHMQGTPATMQKDPIYVNVVSEVDSYFKIRISELKNAGVQQIILDPGFGFGKTIEHNYSLLKHLSVFKKQGLPILVGVSRKSMINKLLHINANDALHATGVLHTLALLQGADILRVHDVKEAVQVIKIVKAYQNESE